MIVFRLSCWPVLWSVLLFSFFPFSTVIGYRACIYVVLYCIYGVTHQHYLCGGSVVTVVRVWVMVVRPYPPSPRPKLFPELPYSPYTPYLLPFVLLILFNTQENLSECFFSISVAFTQVNFHISVTLSVDSLNILTQSVLKLIPLSVIVHCFK